MIGVLGGGFGLYGHLAAIAGLGEPIDTLLRYKPIIETRSELRPFLDAIRFVETEDELMRGVSILVLARRPQDNVETAMALSRVHPDVLLVIEKPTGVDARAAAQLHAMLDAAGAHYRTPYLFLYSGWTPLVAGACTRDISIEWRFPRRQAGDSWKYDVHSGGGSLAYYFIHFLPLAILAVGSPEVRAFEVSRTDSSETVQMHVAGPEGSLKVRFEVGEVEPVFTVRVGGAEVWTGATPFGPMPERGAPDPRIPVLQEFYRKEILQRGQLPSLQLPAINLWSRLEQLSVSI